MKRRYILAPEAARDLVQIRRYLKKESNQETADRVKSVIRSKIVYRPHMKPLQVAAILHGHRNVAKLLTKRL